MSAFTLGLITQLRWQIFIPRICLKKMLTLYRMPKKMNDFNKGLTRLLNDPRTSPFTDQGNAGFKAVISESGMSLTEVCKHVGRGKRSAPPKPKDSELSAARIENLEAKTEG